MVMLGGLKGKLEEMPMPMKDEEEGGMEDMDEDMAEGEMAKPVDLAGVSDDELLAEVKKRQLV